MYEIYNNDFRIAFKKLPNESVKAIITSPPYKRSDGFTNDLILDLAKESYRILKPDGIMAINFGQLAENPSRHHAVHAYISAYLEPGPEIVWIKSMPELGGHFSPLPGSKWLNRKYELIYIFGKSDYALDRYSPGIGIPYRDPSNNKRWKHGRTLQCPGDVFFIPYDTESQNSSKWHSYTWPDALPERLIRLSGALHGDLIVDPFMGSGSTAKAVVRVSKDLNFFGCEVNQLWFQLALDDINKVI